MNYLFRTTLIACLLTCSALSMSEQSQPNPEQAQRQKVYLEHLQYEYRNREHTYLGMRKAAKLSAKSDRGSFYQAYYELELVNQDIYGAMKSKLGVDYRPNWFTRTGLNIFAHLSWRFVSAQQLEDIIVPYIPKLKEMEALSSPEHKPFFYYVVLQEQAQLEASRAALQSDWESGARILREFVEKYRGLNPNTLI